jgi:hypothetical protein
VNRYTRVTAAYPEIEFQPRTLTFFAQLRRTPPECVHLNHIGQTNFWAATLSPDVLYLRGKMKAMRENPRPDVSLCRDCSLEFLERELSAFRGRVIGFEPDGENVTQYFFVPRGDFQSAGLKADLSEAIGRRIERLSGSCEICSATARWIWFSRSDVQSLDDFGSVSSAQGRQLCANHGAAELCAALAKIEQCNLLYVNIPSGEAGAYVWI